MIKIIILAIAILFTIKVKAQSPSKSRMVLQQAVEGMFAALTNADTVALKKYCTRDVRFYEYGQIWTIDTLIQKVILSKTIPDFKRTNIFEFVDTTKYKNRAWVTYYLQSVFTRNGKEDLAKWMETVVLIKHKSQWQVHVLHSTRLVKS